MITRLTLSNYRSIKDLRLDLGALTALVGVNGAGKSNIVDSLRFLSDAMTIGLSGALSNREGIQAVRRWSAGAPFDLTVQVELETLTHRARYAFILGGDKDAEYVVKGESAVIDTQSGHRVADFQVAKGRWLEGPTDLRPVLDSTSLALPLIGGDIRFRLLHAELKAIAVYDIFPDTLRQPRPYDQHKPMDRHGSNWASILKDQDPEPLRNELILALQKLSGDIEDVKVQQIGGLLLIQLRHASKRGKKKKNKWFSLAQESDGTLRVAGIITALLQDPPLSTIGIEEPELTVHPGTIPLLVDYLRQASKKSQVIFTTHSPELLELLEPEDVRVVTREGGITSAGPMTDTQKGAVKKQLLTLGELMRTQGLQAELPFSEAS